MRLDRERLRGREHLEEERQLTAEALDDAIPEDAAGSRAITSGSGVHTPSICTREGALGCAPIHSSASGPLEGEGLPRRSAIAVRDPAGIVLNIVLEQPDLVHPVSLCTTIGRVAKEGFRVPGMGRNLSYPARHAPTSCGGRPVRRTAHQA